jgi:hypothetical protein
MQRWHGDCRRAGAPQVAAMARNAVPCGTCVLWLARRQSTLAPCYRRRTAGITGTDCRAVSLRDGTSRHVAARNWMWPGAVSWRCMCRRRRHHCQSSPPNSKPVLQQGTCAPWSYTPTVYCCSLAVCRQVTIPETGQSFALIFSVEDPHNSGGPLSGVGVQVCARIRMCLCLQFCRGLGFMIKAWNQG